MVVNNNDQLLGTIGELKVYHFLNCDSVELHQKSKMCSVHLSISFIRSKRNSTLKYVNALENHFSLN